MSWGYGFKPLRVGQRLYRLMRAKGLGYADVAKILGVTEATVRKWMNQQGDPDIPLLNVMAKEFNVETDYLLEIDDPNFFPFSKAIRRRFDTFEVKTLEEVEAIKKQYRRASFPYENKCRVKETENGYIVEIVSEFNSSDSAK